MDKKTTTDMNIDHYSDAQVVEVLEREMDLKVARIAQLERQVVRSGERRAEYEEAAWALKERVIELEKGMEGLQTKLWREWGENLKNPNAQAEAYALGFRTAVDREAGCWKKSNLNHDAICLCATCRGDLPLANP